METENSIPTSFATTNETNNKSKIEHKYGKDHVVVLLKEKKIAIFFYYEHISSCNEKVYYRLFNHHWGKGYQNEFEVCCSHKEVPIIKTTHTGSTHAEKVFLLLKVLL